MTIEINDIKHIVLCNTIRIETGIANSLHDQIVQLLFRRANFLLKTSLPLV